MKTHSRTNRTHPSIARTSRLMASWAAIVLLMCCTSLARHAAASQVLLFVDTMGTSRYQTALDNRGYPYQVYTAESAFNQAVQNADTASDVVIVDSIGNFHDFTSLATFVQSGGRAVLQYWALTSGSGLASAFQVNVIQQLATPLPVYDWGGASLLDGVSVPMNLVEFALITDVLKLEPLAGGQAVAGFASAATANQAALVVGNSGRTIVHGFFIEGVELSDDAIQLAINELDYLFGPIAPPAAPWIIAGPQSRTVLAGGSTTLRVSAGGSVPLSYQWQLDATNILGATNSTYSITKAQALQSGSYSVVVSNLHGSAPSAPALLTVTNPASIANVLLFVDGSLPSPYEEVLISLGVSYLKFGDESVFHPVVTGANPADTLVIVDSYDHIADWYYHYSSVIAFVNAGGRSILQYYNLPIGSHLAEAFDVAVAQVNTTAPPVFDWGGSDFFSGLSTPLTFTNFLTVHGQKLQPLAGGQTVAGFVGSPTTDEAAVVVGNAGHTLVNGFMLEEVASSTEATQLARNEIMSFFPLRFEFVSLAGTTLTLSWTAIPFQDYQVQYKESPSASTWFDLGLPVTAFDATASTTDTIAGADQRIYRVQMLP